VGGGNGGVVRERINGEAESEGGNNGGVGMVGARILSSLCCLSVTTTTDSLSLHFPREAAVLFVLLLVENDRSTPGLECFLFENK
jgi:hypothetical protein